MLELFQASTPWDQAMENSLLQTDLYDLDKRGR